MSTPDPHATTTDGYEFTSMHDPFAHKGPAWQDLFHLVTSKAPRALEIGSWEGRSSVFLLTTLCATSGELVCVDDVDLTGSAEERERRRKLTHNLALTGRRPARVLPEESGVPALYTLLEEEANKGDDAGFDWIYIARSHRSDDAESAWQLARHGCIFIFEDDDRPGQSVDSAQRPRSGIDAFLALHEGEFRRIATNPDQHQIVLQKTIPMGVRFSLEPGKDQQLDEALSDRMNIVLTVDSAYAMPAAVTLRSIAENVGGRITLYVFDCGLLAEDKKKIEASLPKRPDITLRFMALPPDSLAFKLGASWARIDVMKHLPAERVLYLDADVLVCKDLRKLWNTDLEGHSLGAVPDVWMPMGHEGVPRGKYFNSGVLLIDLARTRSTIPALERRCHEMKDAVFRDQDPLNVHFRGDWGALSLTWNAHGFGRVPPDVDREKLCLEEMKDPAIVHFIGPLHPSVANVLDPDYQLCHTKPWGFAGASGHPYERAWWDTVEKTAWKGWKETTDYREMCEQAKERAWKMARDGFDSRIGVNEVDFHLAPTASLT